MDPNKALLDSLRHAQATGTQLQQEDLHRVMVKVLENQERIETLLTQLLRKMEVVEHDVLTLMARG